MNISLCTRESNTRSGTCYHCGVDRQPSRVCPHPQMVMESSYCGFCWYLWVNIDTSSVKTLMISTESGCFSKTQQMLVRVLFWRPLVWVQFFHTERNASKARQETEIVYDRDKSIRYRYWHSSHKHMRTHTGKTMCTCKIQWDLKAPRTRRKTYEQLNWMMFQ